ncbi:NmrA family NAD(P)-binding protein [Nocardia sp. R6R-6]|uniref:NmrA family NAD(P)-binding protein n=1 Tax=Nocardia sp. R6R-6 TaxID=3459303 RepID=UPI00403D5EAE
MILVTGGSGRAGRHIVRTLVDNGLDVKAMGTSSRVEELKEIGVKDVCVGDLNKVSDIRESLQSVDKVIFISPAFSGSEFYMGKYFIDEALNAGVGQFVLHSAAHPCLSVLLHHEQKRRIEEYLMLEGLSAGLNFTIVQPPSYMYNFLSGFDQKANTYRSYYAVDSKLTFVDPMDVAEVVVKIVNEGDKHRGATYELAGTEYLSARELVDIYNDVTGSNAICEHVDVDTFLALYKLEDVYARAGFTAMSDVYSKYGLHSNSNVLEWMLGRKPTTFREFLQRTLDRR